MHADLLNSESNFTLHQSSTRQEPLNLLDSNASNTNRHNEDSVMANDKPSNVTSNIDSVYSFLHNPKNNQNGDCDSEMSDQKISPAKNNNDEIFKKGEKVDLNLMQIEANNKSGMLDSEIDRLKAAKANKTNNANNANASLTPQQQSGKVLGFYMRRKPSQKARLYSFVKSRGTCGQAAHIQVKKRDLMAEINLKYCTEESLNTANELNTNPIPTIGTLDQSSQQQPLSVGQSNGQDQQKAQEQLTDCEGQDVVMTMQDEQIDEASFIQKQQSIPSASPQMSSFCTKNSNSTVLTPNAFHLQNINSRGCFQKKALKKAAGRDVRYQVKDLQMCSLLNSNDFLNPNYQPSSSNSTNNEQQQKQQPANCVQNNNQPSHSTIESATFPNPNSKPSSIRSKQSFQTNSKSSVNSVSTSILFDQYVKFPLFDPYMILNTKTGYEHNSTSNQFAYSNPYESTVNSKRIKQRAQEGQLSRQLYNYVEKVQPDYMKAEDYIASGCQSKKAKVVKITKMYSVTCLVVRYEQEVCQSEKEVSQESQICIRTEIDKIYNMKQEQQQQSVDQQDLVKEEKLKLEEENKKQEEEEIVVYQDKLTYILLNPFIHSITVETGDVINIIGTVSDRKLLKSNNNLFSNDTDTNCQRVIIPNFVINLTQPAPQETITNFSETNSTKPKTPMITILTQL